MRQNYEIKIKKRIFTLTLAIAVSGTLLGGNVVSADIITNKGISEYNGVWTDEAYAWTGSNSGGYVEQI